MIGSQNRISDLFTTAGQKELAARLAYPIRERGFGLVTGEIGSGKLTAMRAFIATLGPNRYLVLYLANPTTGITGVYRDLLDNILCIADWMACVSSVSPSGLSCN